MQPVSGVLCLVVPKVKLCRDKLWSRMLEISGAFFTDEARGWRALSNFPVLAKPGVPGGA